MVYSDRCPDLTTYWNLHEEKCVACKFSWIQPGYEFSPNCGFTDDGGQREGRTRVCPDNRYNNGTFKKCQPCTVCKAGYETVSPCSSTTDAQCRPQQPGPTVISTTNQGSTPVSTTLPDTHITSWRVPFVIACVIVAALSSYIIYRRRKRCLQGCDTNQHKTSRERLSSMNEDFAVLGQPESKDLDVILSPRVCSAPLQTVLDHLDVLEELVILLDPEGEGVKNTRHLASRCSYSAAWITYTYSMRDKKSPLKAVLEGVTTKHPEWTVGHLAKLLKDMDRNDAIVVLTKLTVEDEMVQYP